MFDGWIYGRAPWQRALWQDRYQAQQASELQQMKSREPETWKKQEASWPISIPRLAGTVQC
jgi:hypothetical protein